jgi:hypothetical protein
MGSSTRSARKSGAPAASGTDHKDPLDQHGHQHPIALFDPLVNGAVVELSTLSTTSLSVEAVRDVNGEAIGSVIFDYNGKLSFRTENGGPYAMCGDSSGIFTKCTELAVGMHYLTVTTYSLGGGGGTAGPPVTVSFTIVNGTPTAPTPTAPAPTAPTPTAPTPTAPTPTTPIPTAPIPTALTPTVPTQVGQVVGFNLIQAGSSTVIANLVNGAVIPLNGATPNFSVDAFRTFVFVVVVESNYVVATKKVYDDGSNTQFSLRKFGRRERHVFVRKPIFPSSHRLQEFTIIQMTSMIDWGAAASCDCNSIESTDGRLE